MGAQLARLCLDLEARWILEDPDYVGLRSLHDEEAVGLLVVTTHAQEGLEVRQRPRGQLLPAVLHNLVVELNGFLLVAGKHPTPSDKQPELFHSYLLTNGRCIVVQ